MHFDIIIEQLSEPFNVSTPIGDSILTDKLYRDCTISHQSKEYHELLSLVRHSRV